MKSAGDPDLICQDDIPGCSGASSSRMSLRERPRKPVERKRRPDEMKFLDDFDPEKSNREKRKIKRKTGNYGRAYDENGHIRHSGLDVCDCLSVECPGCWFPCDMCGSKKCGMTCRVNRKFYYESISFDGKDTYIKNNFFPPK